MENLYLKLNRSIQNETVFIYLLSTILITIPLSFAFGSISCIVFLIVTIYSNFKNKEKTKKIFNKTLFLSILFYFIMLLSLLWTNDLYATLSGLQKEVLFFAMPIAFLFLPRLSKEAVDKIFRLYSFGMSFFSAYYFSNALIKFISTGNRNVFFFHELVTVELNAIYVAVFASFGMFYFLSIKNKTIIDRVASFALAFFVFLLSSKTVFLIDVLLIIVYYIYFSGTPKAVRTLTILSATFFLVFSILFVDQVRERFLLEYETAFVDNTVNKNYGSENNKVYNVTLRQAWFEEKFSPNQFFPGTAYRVFHIRIFNEMQKQYNMFFTGLGLEASKPEIKKKYEQYNLFPEQGYFNFHNQFLQTFAEIGLFGALVLIMMLFLNLKNAITHKDFLHIVFAVTMIILLLTESIFCRQRGIIFFITLYCIFNSINGRKDIVNINK